MKDERSAAKFHYIKTVSGKVVAHSIAFRVVSIYWQGEDPFPLKSADHQLKSYAASKSRLKLASCAVLSADAGLLVSFRKIAHSCIVCVTESN